MLKRTPSFVLAVFKGSTYEKKYASPFHLLRPRWMVFLNILQNLQYMCMAPGSALLQGSPVLV